MAEVQILQEQKSAGDVFTAFSKHPPQRQTDYRHRTRRRSGHSQPRGYYVWRNGMNKEFVAGIDRWELLKEDARTCVYKTTLNDAPVVVKTYCLESLFRRLQFWRKKAKVKKFYRSAGEQLKIPKFLSAGFFADQRKGYLCYSNINGKDFRNVDWGALPERTASSLMKQAAEALWQVHKIGWAHGDFKFGNLLYCEEQDQVYLLDVEGFRKPLFSSMAKARDVARFILNGLELSLSEPLLQHFWQSYSKRLTEQEVQQLKEYTQGWLGKLSRRHQRNYGRSVNLEKLTFL